jgi:prepilin-type N-terminal cleavage/methylation domain-containing protein
MNTRKSFRQQGFRQQGLTLVEIIVAIAIFSIIMLALSGTIVSGLQLRRDNTLESQALAYAASVLEQHKSFWADPKNYACYNPDSANGLGGEDCPPAVYAPALPPVPQAFANNLVTIDISCVDLAGNTVANATCKAKTPPLRRVAVAIKDQQGKVRANLLTEIGNPQP